MTKLYGSFYGKPITDGMKWNVAIGYSWFIKNDIDDWGKYEKYHQQIRDFYKKQREIALSD